MLITKSANIKWNNKNKRYYKSKGYLFTKLGDEFIIKINDLARSSQIKVEVKCDNENCEYGQSKFIQYAKYINRYTYEDGKYYCNKCARKIYGAENTRKTKLKNGTSFEQWCIDNERQDILDRWDYTLNDKLPSEVNCKSSRKYYLKCPKGIHISELKNIASCVRNNTSFYCKQCNSFAQFLTDIYGNTGVELYWDSSKNVINPLKISVCSRKKIWINCQEKDYHGSYETTCDDFKQGYRCSYCSKNKKIHALDSLGTLYPQVLEIWSDKNEKTPYDYSPKSKKEVWWKCEENIHGDYRRNITSSNNYNFRCPECVRERDESFLQEKVRLYLENLSYTILHEYNCTIIPTNPKKLGKNNTLPFDNEIKELMLIIEVHGNQHYLLNKWHILKAKIKNTTPEYELHYQKLKDRYKRILAKSKGYEYLEIPYWTDDKEETWKKLIDEKLQSSKK